MVLDALFGWVLAFDLWLGILILAFLITLLMNLVYMWVTDQKEMKRLKKQLKEMQKKMRSEKDNPKKMMSLQKKMMDLNFTYMKKSLRPALYTFIPIIVVFGWMAANLAFAPIVVDQQVPVVVTMEEPAYVTLDAPGVSFEGSAEQETLEREVSWLVSASDPGNYTLTFSTRDGASASRELVVGSFPGVAVESHESPFDQSEVEYPKATPFGDFSIGNYQPGWLATYIVFSLVLSILMRKVMGLS